MQTPDQFQFETPENIRISYAAAGLGSRFVAWVIDQLLVFLLLTVLIVALLFAGIGADSLSGFGELVDDGASGDSRAMIYAAGIAVLVFGLGSFLYYGVSEYLYRGQTIGKRNQSLRVVKADGFALDGASVFLRNLFRVIDHIPALWVVPLVSGKSQRLGDMVAGTLVVSDKVTQLGGMREQLLARATADVVFRFSPAKLRMARDVDVQAAERVLERGPEAYTAEMTPVVSRLAVSIAKRLEVEPPSPELAVQFLRDFLTAEYRRQHQKLG
jgi:uncharacterized RDD family membrane protein YckC